MKKRKRLEHLHHQRRILLDFLEPLRRDLKLKVFEVESAQLQLVSVREQVSVAGGVEQCLRDWKEKKTMPSNLEDYRE